MNKKKLIFIITVFFINFYNYAQVNKVEIIKINNSWKLLRNGNPYYIKGAGCEDLKYFKNLADAGGNSIRTWSPDNGKEVLDKAHELGLTVMMGLWAGQERQGFDYDNEPAVKTQLNYFKSVVKQYKDHPALLMWGVGNEVDLFYTNTKVWDAIQDIAKMIHEIDPNHPVTTVTAGLDPVEVKLIQEKAPDIDIYSINTYREVCSASNVIRKAGWNKPYLFAEWGPAGHWEVRKTMWNAPIEQNSHEKALQYVNSYECIIEDTSMCIGSYTFLWGHKQEVTSTWYGMFTKKGQITEVIDYVTNCWTGKFPLNIAPYIDSAKIENFSKYDNIELICEEIYHGKVYAKDDNNKLKFSFKIYPESTVEAVGGDFQDDIPPISGLIKKSKFNQVTFMAPKNEGAYRLFIFVNDDIDKIAYANIPFYSNPRPDNMKQRQKIKLKTRSLKLNE